MRPVDRVAGLEADHRGPAPLGERGPGLGRGQGAGPHRPLQRRHHGLDGPGDGAGGRTQDAGHAGVVRVGGAVDQLGLGPAVALEHLGDLEHAEQLAPLAPEGEAAGVDPDRVGDAEADRDRPQGAVGQAHRLGDRPCSLAPMKPVSGL